MNIIRWHVARSLVRLGWKIAGFRVSPGQITVPGRGIFTL